MSKNIRRIVTYVKMIMLYMILSAIVLYLAGAPLASYFIAKGKMIIIQGAPGYQGEKDLGLSKLVLDQQDSLVQSENQVPEPDTQYGTITCERIALLAPVYYGDSEADLQSGVGQYPNGVLPGDGKPFMISGHDTTFFAPLEQVKIGDIVRIKTGTITYSYSVVSKIIAEASDTSAYDLTQEKEQLILYTCYPFGQLVGNRSKRFFVACDRITENDSE